MVSGRPRRAEAGRARGARAAAARRERRRERAREARGERSARARTRECLPERAPSARDEWVLAKSEAARRLRSGKTRLGGSRRFQTASGHFSAATAVIFHVRPKQGFYKSSTFTTYLKVRFVSYHSWADGDLVTYCQRPPVVPRARPRWRPSPPPGSRRRRFGATRGARSARARSASALDPFAPRASSLRPVRPSRAGAFIHPFATSTLDPRPRLRLAASLSACPLLPFPPPRRSRHLQTRAARPRQTRRTALSASTPRSRARA